MSDTTVKDKVIKAVEDMSPDVTFSEFDVFLTIDRNLTAQQNLSNRNIAIVVLVAPSNRIEALTFSKIKKSDISDRSFPKNHQQKPIN